MRGRVVVSLRALASPIAIASLVLLLLNDHVLKQAWPGWTTGKLSDVAGLVVAPLVLAVALSLVGLSRPIEWACGLTALGFTLVKSYAAAAAAASTLWSLTGIPTTMRADPTDLIALPAVWAAWVVHRRAERSTAAKVRQPVAAALGLGLLPIAVLATAATSCDPDDGVTDVWVASGDWTGPPGRVEERIVIDDDGRHLVLGSVGVLAGVALPDGTRLVHPPPATGTGACDAAGTCWRIAESSPAVVERSDDAGETWVVDVRISSEQTEAALEGQEGGCGDAASARVSSLTVMPPGSAHDVVLAARHAGVLVRSTNGEWSFLATDDTPGATHSSEAGGTPAGDLVPVPPTPAPGPPDEASTGPPSGPACPSPSQRTVTPNPANGPPTTYEVCPE